MSDSEEDAVGQRTTGGQHATYSWRIARRCGCSYRPARKGRADVAAVRPVPVQMCPIDRIHRARTAASGVTVRGRSGEGRWRCPQRAKVSSPRRPATVPCTANMQHATCNKQHKTDTVQLLSADQPICLALVRAHAVWHKPLPPPVGSRGPRSCAAPAQCADHSAIHVGRSHDERRVGRSRAAHGSEPHGQLGGSRGRRGAHCCNGDEPCRRCAAASSAESDGKHGLGPTKPRCRCGRGEFIPGAERAGVSPVPVQMWQG